MSNEKLLQDLEIQARELYVEKDFQKVVESYSQFISQLTSSSEYMKSNPRNQILALAFNNRGHSKYMQVEFDEALQDYEIALQYDDTLAVAYYNIGTIHYRLCQPIDSADKLKSLKEALEDFNKAIELQPENQEFKKGQENCRKLYDEALGDGSMSDLLKWPEISDLKLVKLLFLLDSGDKTAVREHYHDMNFKAVIEGIRAFADFLNPPKLPNIPTSIRDVLKTRVQVLYDYQFITDLPGADAYDARGFKYDEDLLIFTSACHLLEIGCGKFDPKKQKVQDKLELNGLERMGNFFIHTENLRLNNISDKLSPVHVYKMFQIFKEKKKFPESNFDVDLTQLKNVEGLKDALFFYIIRLLESKGMLNRIYTKNLAELLDSLSKQLEDGNEKRMISDIIKLLSIYPNECKPPGHCIAFCVEENRNGALGEIEKITELFEETLGYTLDVKKDPDWTIITDCITELKKVKYRYYDSLVLWFMSHGCGTKLKLLNGPVERKEIIDEFSKLDNFRRKPKIFFMTACQGNEPIVLEEGLGGTRYAVDAGNIDVTQLPDEALNLSAVHFKMDRIIANAALPDKFAFRDETDGSVYVETVCRLMKRRRGENITLILEEACNIIHQILFTSEEFQGEGKQGCSFESFFQKTFIVPV